MGWLVFDCSGQGISVAIGSVDAKLVRFRASLNLIQAVGMVIEPHSVAKSEFLLSIRDIV